MRNFFLIPNLLIILFSISCYDEANNNDNTVCYSPNQNLDIAYDVGARGCVCYEANDNPVCLQDGSGRNVALICENNIWQAVEGGPCIPLPPNGNDNIVNEVCFSPVQNLDIAYDAGATGCACDEENDIEVCLPDSTGRLVALICINNIWHAVEDGPCMPSPPSWMCDEINDLPGCQ